jgi:hypothetical protein
VLTAGIAARLPYDFPRTAYEKREKAGNDAKKARRKSQLTVLMLRPLTKKRSWRL